MQPGGRGPGSHLSSHPRTCGQVRAGGFNSWGVGTGWAAGLPRPQGQSISPTVEAAAPGGSPELGPLLWEENGKVQLTRLLALTALPERTNSEAQARGTTTPRGPRHRDAGATLSRGGGGGGEGPGAGSCRPHSFRGALRRPSSSGPRRSHPASEGAPLLSIGRQPCARPVPGDTRGRLRGRQLAGRRGCGGGLCPTGARSASSCPVPRVQALPATESKLKPEHCATARPLPDGGRGPGLSPPPAPPGALGSRGGFRSLRFHPCGLTGQWQLGPDFLGQPGLTHSEQSFPSRH